MSKINKINVDGVSYDIEDALNKSNFEWINRGGSSVLQIELSGLEKGYYPLFRNNDNGLYIKEIGRITTGLPLVLMIENKFNDADINSQIGMIFVIRNYGSDPGGISRYIIKKTGETTASYSTSDDLTNGKFLLNIAQNITGVKTFASIPRVSSYTAPTVDTQLTAKKYVDDLVATKTIQYSTMPTASSTNEGKIVQYIGTTDSTYTNGYFYVCVSDGQDPATYSWEEIPVQKIDDIGNGVFTTAGQQNSNNDFIISELKRGIYIFDETAGTGYESALLYRWTRTSGIGSISGLSSNKVGGKLLLIVFKSFDELPNENIYTPMMYLIGCSNRDNESGQWIGRTLEVNKLGASVRSSGAYQHTEAYFLTKYAQPITGVKTFNSIPKQALTYQSGSYVLLPPTQDDEFTNKKYVDDAIAAISSGASVNYFDARQAFLFEGKDVGIYYPTNTNRINFMYNFLSGDSGGAKNGTVISFVIVNKVTAENPDSTKTYAVGTFLDGAGALQQFVVTYNGTNYVMTYYNNYYGAYMLTNYAQTINGIKTFGSFPVTPSSAPTSDYQTANKKYVDDLVGNINTVLATLTTPSNGGGN